MAISRNNNYVPQAYLQRWGNQNNILVYQLLVPHENYPNWQRQSIQHTASIKNLYVRLDGVKASDSFVDFFNHYFENDIRQVI